MTINNLIHYKKSVVKNFDTFLEFIQFTDDLVSRKEYCILEYDEYSLSLLFFDGPQYYMTCNILEIIFRTGNVAFNKIFEELRDQINNGQSLYMYYSRFYKCSDDIEEKLDECRKIINKNSKSTEIMSPLLEELGLSFNEFMTYYHHKQRLFTFSDTYLNDIMTIDRFKKVIESDKKLAAIEKEKEKEFKFFDEKFPGIYEHIIPNKSNIDIRRAPESKKKVFDFITVEYSVYADSAYIRDDTRESARSEFIKAHMKQLINYAIYLLTNSKKFKKYGIPVTSLKIYSIKKSKEYMCFYFCLKDFPKTPENDSEE